MTTQLDRRDILPLLQELQEACRRPLFTEIGLDDAVRKQERRAKLHQKLPDLLKVNEDKGSSDNDTTKEPKKRSWRQLLRDASQLLPAMTEKEHDQVSQLAAILFLGYLLPHSTGNEFFLLQHTPDTLPSENSDNANDETKSGAELAQEYILQMDLEERLESTCRQYRAFEFGEMGTLTDLSWEAAFFSFCRDGLVPFLGGRAASLQQVDLIHLLAMVIHPQPTETTIKETIAELRNRPCWERARRLMANRHAHSFNVNYEHRLRIIQWLARDFALPAFDSEAPLINCPLFDGALTHLRASLHAFAMGAISLKDAHWARSAVLSIAVQSRIGVVLKEEWDFLINRIVDDRVLYEGCHCCHKMLRKQSMGNFGKEGTYYMDSDYSSFCPHAARGIHMAEFLTSMCQSRGSTVGTTFFSMAFSSLTDAVEWQMHCWKKPDDDEDEDTSDISEEPPCMLASLIFAARHFIYFLFSKEMNTKADNGEEDDDIATRREDLIACAVQLIHHPDKTVVSEASELLALAFAYGSKPSVDIHGKTLFASLQVLLPTIQNDSKVSAELSRYVQSSIQKMVSAASRISLSFAILILNLLFESLKIPGETEQEQFFLRVVSSVAAANPGAAAQNSAMLIEMLEKRTDKSSQAELLAAVLACRQAYFFERAESQVGEAILKIAQQLDDPWKQYQLARLALQTGNYSFAGQCYQNIFQTPLNEKYYLWMSALSKIADAENGLSKFAARGIPMATTKLRSALTIFQSIHAVYLSPESDFSFQINVVSLQLDFLDVLTGLRQIIREMRLTGDGPAKRTRSFLHFQNLIKCCDALACRYHRIFRRHGLFLCQQSRSALKTLHTVCRFVARAIRVVFSDMLSLPTKMGETWPGTGHSGDRSLPISRFMQCLNERLLDKMRTSVDPVIRAAAMLEMMDGILLCPWPFPVDFLRVSGVPSGCLQLIADPDQCSHLAKINDRLDVAEGYPGISFGVLATGEIPSAFLAKTKLEFASVVLCHRADYAGPLEEEEHVLDEKQEDDKQEEDEAAASPAKTRPWEYKELSTNLRANGKFEFRFECPPIREEGNYSIEIKLGCRDVRGGEWDISLPIESTRLRVQVSRSNL